MQGISCADVADICVKALHDSTARNKSFDVRKKKTLYCELAICATGSEMTNQDTHLICVGVL